MGSLLKTDLGTHQLVPHPDYPRPPISIDVGVEQFALIGMESIEQDSVMLVLSYRIRGNLTGISLPEFDFGRPQQGDKLWEHSCFEAFCRASETEEYYEANVAPSRQWAMYRFDSYRTGMREDVPAIPRIFYLPTEGGFGLQVRLCFPIELCSQLALSAVIEETDGTKSYWALAHPPGKPDFHHPDCFALALAAPSAS